MLWNKGFSSGMDRKLFRQYACYNNSNSEFKETKCGIRQGSILGPLLFMLYTVLVILTGESREVRFMCQNSVLKTRHGTLGVKQTSSQQLHIFEITMPASVLSPSGLFIPMLNVFCGSQSSAPFHRLPRVRCLYLPVSPNKVGVLKSFAQSTKAMVFGQR